MIGVFVCLFVCLLVCRKIEINFNKGRGISCRAFRLVTCYVLQCFGVVAQDSGRMSGIRDSILVSEHICETRRDGKEIPKQLN